jgi:hypothetical protein
LFGLTQLESTLAGDVTVTAAFAPLPTPIELTPEMLDPGGRLDQLERFEGMRLHAASLTSVAPTNGFGEIATVLTGVPRPLREPGISLLDPVPPDPTPGREDCCIPRFDENPERILVDTEGLAGAAVLPVTSNVVLSDVTGPLDFTFGAYKILPEAPPTAGPNIVGIDSVSQERALDTFINPNSGQPEPLHDRPPLVLRATVDPFGLNPRGVTIVVNHLRSFIDIELVAGEGSRVRAKRKAQAESVAGLLQELQMAEPDVPVVSVGDYNAYQFSDGYTDPIATLNGLAHTRRPGRRR